MQAANNNEVQHNPQQFPIKSDWNSQDLNAFYNQLPIQTFKKLSGTSGLTQCDDLHNIEEYINSANSILEVGGGYGRVIDFLIKKNAKKITAIERNKKFSEYLTQKYSDKVQINQGDILSTELNEKYDLILLMWSTLLENNIEEQPQIFKKLKSLLKPNGHIIIDLISKNIARPTQNMGKNYCVWSYTGYYYFYWTSMEELMQMNKDINIRYIKRKDYMVQNSHRTSLVFQNDQSYQS